MRRLVPFVLLTLFTALAAGRDAKPPEGFTALFNGKDLAGWKVYADNMAVWGAEKGVIFCQGGGGGWLLTEKDFGDYELRLEYKMSKGANSGVALRTPTTGDPAYVGMEIQLIDDEGWPGKLADYQHTGSIYGMFMGFPGLKIALPSTPADAKGLMAAAIRDDNPVCYLINYLLVLEHGDVPEGE